jgi:hypothetical protein
MRQAVRRLDKVTLLQRVHYRPTATVDQCQVDPISAIETLAII